MLADDLLSGADAASAFCGIPVRTIYHLVEKERLPVIRLGRRLFFRKSELECIFRAAPPPLCDPD